MIVAGLIWPSTVAAAGVVYTYRVGTPGYEAAILAVLYFGLLGGLPLAAGFFQRLPLQWPEGKRLLIAVGLTIPAMGLAICAAVCLFVYATLRCID
jgi:hypothetical protein